MSMFPARKSDAVLFISILLAGPAILRSSTIRVDFSNGAPSLPNLQVSPLNGGVLNYNGGRLNVSTSAEGDGATFHTDLFAPRCFVFDGLDAMSFAAGQGLSFDLIFGDPDSISASVRNSKRVPDTIDLLIQQTKDKTTNTLVSTTIGPLSVDKVGGIRLDWVEPDPKGSGKDRFEMFVRDKSGLQLKDVIVDSDIKHDPSHPIEVDIKQIGTLEDPAVSISSVTISDLHTPEPQSCTMLAIGLAVFWMLRRSPGMGMRL